MFETAELGHKIPRAEFEKAAEAIRMELLMLQQELRQASFPVIVVFAGVDAAGKGETINVLNEWMDPRGLITRAYDEPSDEERERPEFWRFWRDLPPRGKIGLLLSTWYSRPVLRRVHGKSSRAELDAALDNIIAFEKELADDGALVLKFWMHLGKKAQQKRLRALERDPLESWRVKKQDWKNWERYDQFIAVAERVIMRTSTGQAPWTLVEGADPHYRALKVATVLRDSIKKHLEAQAIRKQLLAATSSKPVAKASKGNRKGSTRRTSLEDGLTILRSLDRSLALDPKTYQTELRKEQGRLHLLQHRARERGVSAILVFEGWDAAGKGGAIRRLTQAIDARSYQVIPIAAPTDEERAHHYLWRFWRHLSRAGRVTVFDRSWYGRVLVERVEGFATEPEWQRAFAEINHFEEQLVQHGIVICKYWLHITNDEQLRRFKERDETPYKSYKLTDEDWRNRDRWGEYEAAVNDIAARTSTRIAPWTLVEANDKRYARVKVIRTFCERLEQALG
jgi:AMP-polyphosphate phosphotransferase